MNIIERLAFDLDGSHLVIRFAMTRHVEMTALLVSAAGPEDAAWRFPIAPCADPGYMFEAVVDLVEVAHAWAAGSPNLSFFIENISPIGETIVRRVGRAARTERPARSLVARINGLEMRAMVGVGGNLRLAVAESLPGPALTTETVSFRPEGGAFEVRMRTIGDHALESATLVFVDRHTGTQARVPMALSVDAAATSAHHGRLCHVLEARVDMAAVTRALPADSAYVSFAVQLVDDRELELLRPLELGEDRKADRKRAVRPLTVTTAERTSHYVPYLTFKGSRIALKVDHFDPPAFQSLQRRLRWAWLMPVVRLFAGVWLVGELPDRAQDNGYHFFRWVREHHPRRRIYYVIAPHSPRRARLERLGNAVVRGSEEHVRLALRATRLVSTHLPEYLLPTPDPRLSRHANGVRVFLQHGIMGMKNMVANYGRRRGGFHCDIFHVTSMREREMIINDFGYLPSQVRITGLPRFDALLAPGSEPEGVLVLPTWREGLLLPESFRQSEFLQRWRELLGDARIKRLLEAGERVTFVLHPNLAHHTSMLEAPDGVRILRQGEADVQDLLRDHRALITDYSSVGFDFALQGRPVYYFQFDRDRFLGSYPSHLDPVADLPGYTSAFANEILDEVERDWRAGFPMQAEYAARIARWVDHPDRDNCLRVYESVRRSGGIRGLLARLRSSDAAGRLYERFRGGRLYRPAMRALMTLARALPRSGTVVFESGNGLHYAGNPRAIYEELVRRDPGVRTVWSTTSTFRPYDVTTRKVRPRTPRYYWELGRARSWVSDQNLGVDVRPARRTYYLQSWHGTPLKRMQHDALSQEGRRPGYLERVTRQTGYWSALLSPSAYASECFRSAFRFDGRILELGYPRNDVLAGPDLGVRSAATRARLGVAHDATVVLYAPTFRDNAREGNRYLFQPDLDFDTLARALPDDVVLLVRAHHVTGRTARIPRELRGRVVDVTTYEDAQDLLAAADALVTDYSSVMFDFALTRRPIVFFCPDLEEYAGQVRGFYFDLAEEAPGPIVRTQEQLVEALGDLEGVKDRYRDKVEGFVSRYGPLDDGAAAARVVDNLLER